MTTEQIEKTLNNLCKKADSICELSKTAKRNSKSLAGSNFYADKFHNEVVGIAKDEGAFVRSVETCVPAPILDRFKATVSKIKRVDSAQTARAAAARDLRLLCQSEIIPHVRSASPSAIPNNEHILPMDVVTGTRGYLESYIRQANGCYEHQWYDACSVMIRKFVEVLLIEMFEAHGNAADIKNKNDDFFMLGEIIDRTVSSTHWNLGRETKRCLPEIKSLGDRSAHTRRYITRKKDVDNVLPGLRVIADELIHLAKLR